MKPNATTNQSPATLQLKRLSIAVLVALGSLSTNHLAEAGPGAVPACDDGSAVDFTVPSAPTCPPGGALVQIPTYYANSPQLRKFVDTLPGLTPANANNLGQYISVTTKDSASYPGSDYYELAVVEYTEKMHSDLIKPTTLRGYVQIDRATTNAQADTPSSHPYSLKYPDGSQIYVAKEKGFDALTNKWDHTIVKGIDGKPVMVAAIAFDKPHYLGAAIIATRGVATRIKMNNLLPKGRAGLDGNGILQHKGDMFLPVDENLPGAGNSPIIGSTFPQNRVAIHLHGGDSPWISDGTPHQWFSAETDPLLDPILKRGDRAFNVPDMPDPGEAAQTIYWPNDQTARLMWYHDHTFGLTRQNAYVGMATAYLVVDPAEDAALAAAIPSTMPMLPLVIQDKTFVPNDIATQDAKWDQGHWGKPGDLWFPHVYEPAVIKSPTNSALLIDNPAGRWDYGPTVAGAGTTFVQPLLPLPTGDYGSVSTSPEAYMDTAMVNGVAYPTYTVDPKAYRVRFLNGANDRYFNLSLWEADGSVTSSDGRTNTEVKMVPEVLPNGFTIPVNGGGAGYSNPVVTIIDAPISPSTKPGYGSGATATATFDATGAITSVTLTNVGSGYSNPQVQITDPTGTGATVTLTTVAGRVGGIPDPATAGPAIIQFGNETGLLPHPVIRAPKAINFAYDLVNNVLGDEVSGGFYLGNAERGDTVIDFSQYAGKTLIMYNDSVAPIPTGDPNYDYFTGNPDRTSAGGAPTTLPGYGPNTRTIMQIKVAASAADPAYDPAGNGGPLATVLPAAYAAKADAHIESGVVYDGKPTVKIDPATGNPLTDVAGQPIPVTLNDWMTAHTGLDIQYKSIEGGEDVNFGRLIANFGTNKVLTIAGKETPIGYIDQATEIVEEGKVQYWHIRNNDADNHPIHFHLYNVQVLARVNHDATNTLVNPTPDEAGWKETVQNWPFQDVIVALKPITPALPFGLPDSVRLKDPTLNPNDDTNTSMNYSAAAPGSVIPEAFLQYDLLTGQAIPGIAVLDPNTGLPAIDPVTNLPVTKPAVINDIQNYGWEYVFHCHILGHEENDLMRPMIFKPIPVVAPSAPTGVALDEVNGKVTWTDATPVSGSAFIPGTDANGNPTKSGNPANEIGFRVEYAPTIDGVPQAYANATSLTTESFVKIPDFATLKLDQPGKINVIANKESFETDFAGLATAKPNTNLAFRVVAVTQAGETPSATFTEFVQTPAAPTINTVAASTVTPTAVDINWTDNATNETGFRVERSPAGANTWTTAATVASKNVTTAQDTTTKDPNLDYDYRVFATNSKGDSAVSGTLLLTQPPKAPSLSTVAISTTTAGAVDLTWTDNSSNETNFRVERADVLHGVIGAYAPVGNLTAANITTFQDATALPNSDYSYRVVAVNGALSGNASNALSLIQLPAAPVLSSAVLSTVTTGAIDLTWQDKSSNETGFRVERAMITNGVIGTYAQVGTTLVAANTLTFKDTTAPLNADYSYRVIAVNSKGDSDITLANALTVNQAPVAPVVAPVTVTGTTATISWTESSTNETGFRVLRAAPGTAVTAATGWTTVATVAANILTAQDATIAANTDYDYRVVADNGALSNSSSVVTLAQAPAAVTGLAVSTVPAITARTLTLTWTDNASNEAGFAVEFSTDGVTWLPQGTAPASVAGGLVTYAVTGLTPATQYQFRVSATKANFNTQFTAAVSALTPAELLAPTLAAPISSVVNGVTQALLTWADTSTGETAYRVERCAGTSAQCLLATANWVSLSTTLPAGTLTYTDSTLVTGVNYVYRVRALATTGAGVTTLGPIATSTQVTGAVAVTAPTGLTATSPTGVGVTLSWTDASTNETSFQVERALAPATPGTAPVFATVGTVARSTALGTATTGLVTFTDATAAAGQNYIYQVRAVRTVAAVAPAVATVSMSTPSNQAAFTLTITAPTALTAVQAGANMTLSWTDTSANETAFEVLRTDTTGATAPAVFTVARTAAQGTSVNTAVTYSDVTAVVGTPYTYAVRAVVTPAVVAGAVAVPGYSAYTAPVNATVIIPAPTGLTTALPVAPATGVVLNWVDNATFETAYQINRAVVTLDAAGNVPAGTVYTALATVTRTTAQRTAVGAASYTDATANTAALPVGQVYSYQVVAVNTPIAPAFGVTTFSLPSNEAHTAAAVALTGAPTALTAVTSTGTSIVLSWIDNTAAETAYQVKRTDNTNPALPVVVTTNFAVIKGTGTKGTYTDLTAVVGTNYTYTVTAITPAGNLSASITAGLTLNAPTAATATSVATGIQIGWTDQSNNETGFQISRVIIDPVTGLPTGAPTFYAVTSTATQKTAVGTLRNYIDTTALPGVTYSYTVASVSGAAVSAAVSTTPVTITGAAIANPGAPTAVVTNATRITLTWTDLSSNETGFVIERLITPTVAGATPPVWTTLATVARTAANSTSVNKAVTYLDNLVAPVVQGTYQYRVTAINATGVVAPALPPSSAAVLSNVVDFNLPAAPTALTATTTIGVPGVINLSWTDNATNETGFTVQRATNATFTRGLVSTVVPGANSGNPVSYALNGLTTGAKLYIRVQATNASGASTFATVGTVNPTTGVVTPTLVLVP